MNVPTNTIECADEPQAVTDAEAERNIIEQSGSLHAVHWVVVLVSFIITLVAWGFSSDQVKRNSSAQFEHQTNQILNVVADRMKQYEDGLWGGVSALQSHGGQMSRDDWRTYAKALKIDEKYPGINGIGVIHFVREADIAAFEHAQNQTMPEFKIYPMHHGDIKLPITYIEPQEINAKAVGLDVAHEINRFTAAMKARETGDAQITGPINLVQDDGNTPGFLFYAPYYRLAPGNDTKEFIGLVYAPFVFKKLIAGTLGKENRQLHFTVRDADNVLYSEDIEAHPAPEMGNPFTQIIDLELYGRTWSFSVWADPEFRQQLSSNEPLVILIGGLMIDGMLFVLFVLLTRSNRKALDFADLATQQLQRKADELATSNADLEKFAYMTSHDLKTPLRGMGDLTEYLEEDLEPYTASPGANPQVQYNIERMHTQILRMDNLIKGILVYSGIGRGDETVESLDLNFAVRAIGNELSLSEHNLILANTLPQVKTNVTRLNQVLSNLIGNAEKYHHDIATAKIVVSSELRGDWMFLSVSDNGPGIDPMFHSKIFEPFQSLQPKDQIESTGIGLSIVKRTIEFYEGEIAVESELGHGTKFTFSWPISASHSSLKDAA
jgi:signal transduction histidine kinase